MGYYLAINNNYLFATFLSTFLHGLLDLAINNNYLFAFSECTEGEVRLTAGNGSIPAEGNVELLL